MSQLSIFSENKPILKTATTVEAREAYCDVFVKSYLDEKTNRIRVKPLSGQPYNDLFIRCSHKARTIFPVGTIFKIDVYVAQGRKGKKYLIARAKMKLVRAIEYFEHNIALQKGESLKS